MQPDHQPTKLRGSILILIGGLLLVCSIFIAALWSKVFGTICYAAGLAVTLWAQYVTFRKSDDYTMPGPVIARMLLVPGFRNTFLIALFMLLVLILIIIYR